MVTKDRIDDEHRRDVKLAWLGEMLHRQETLPSLKSLLSEHDETRQTVGQQRVVMAAVCERFGLRMRKTTKAPKVKDGR